MPRINSRKFASESTRRVGSLPTFRVRRLRAEKVGLCAFFYGGGCVNHGNPNWGTGGSNPGSSSYSSFEVGGGMGVSINTGDFWSGSRSLW
jgi:hypothetical protein